MAMFIRTPPAASKLLRSAILAGSVQTALSLALLSATIPPVPARAADDKRGLVIASWGGAYQQAQAIADFGPFTQSTGIAIAAQRYDGSLTGIKAKLAGSPAPDVIDVSSAVLSQLCDAKLLAKIDASTLAGQGVTGSTQDAGAAPGDDFLAGAVSPCGIGSLAWSAPLVFNRHSLSREPTSIADLLDTRRFPGKRALPATPDYTLELALMADGVAPGDVYQTLSTPEGVDRAFAALDKIKSDILWWTNPKQPMDWISSGKAAMGLAYSGRMFRASLDAPGKIGVLWDGQIYDFDAWAIPAASGNQDEAKRFIAFALEPQRLASQAALTAYGPMRKSAIPLVGKQPLIGVDMQPFLPTTPEHLAHALKFDQRWWDAHGQAIAQRFASWRAAPGDEAAGAGDAAKP
jgi:putative spermidine/putrescine transport system substrate-binding protein